MQNNSSVTKLIKPDKVQISPYSVHQANNMRRTATVSVMRGFTIIEVMIVLAIAALILLVVFLAVPALQRSQRNNARKTDASRVAASAIDFVTNNNSAPPTTAAQCGTIKDSSAALSEFDSIPAGACAAAGVALPAAPA